MQMKPTFFVVVRPPCPQGDEQQETARNRGARAELRQLEPAIAEGAAGPAEQLGGAVPRGPSRPQRPHTHDTARPQGDERSPIP